MNKYKFLCAIFSVILVISGCGQITPNEADDEHNSSGTGPAASHAPAWHMLGGTAYSDDNKEGEISFDSKGMAYVAYVNGTKLTIKKFNGSTWEQIGVVGECTTEMSVKTHGFSIFVHQDQPYVAFVDAARGNAVTIVKYNGKTWEFVGVPGFLPPVEADKHQAYAQGVWLYFFKGEMFLGYHYYSEFNWNNYGAVFKEDAGSWRLVFGSLGSSYCRYIQFTDSDNELYLAHDYGVRKYDPINKTFNLVGESLYRPSVAVLDGIVYAGAYSGAYIQACKYNGVCWEFIPTPSMEQASAAIIRPIQVEEYNGLLLCSYVHGYGDITVKTYDGEKWTILGKEDFTTGGNLIYDLKVNNGIPFIIDDGKVWVYN